MRRAHDGIEAEELVRGRRLGFEDVERRARDMARFQRLVERVLDDEAAARAIDDPHPPLAFGDRRRIDDVAGLVGQAACAA